MKKEIIIGTEVAVLGAVLVMAPFAAFAQTAAVTTDASVSTSAAGVTTGATASGKTKGTFSLSTAIAKGDAAIEARITNLNDLSARINQMKEVSASEKSSLQASISTALSDMTTLKAKIDADTDATTLKTDLQSITKDYRIYALILPQGRIAAASDRVTTIVGMMQNIETPLSTRISAGNNVSGAQAAYADLQAKVADANTQGNAALSETASLQPDQGNATVEASNTAAIKDAASKLKTAEADLKAARADITTIMADIKGTGSTSAGANVSASPSASAQ